MREEHGKEMVLGIESAVGDPGVEINLHLGWKRGTTVSMEEGEGDKGCRLSTNE